MNATMASSGPASTSSTHRSPADIDNETTVNVACAEQSSGKGEEMT